MYWNFNNFFFDSDFPSPCFDVPKASNFTSGEVQNHETKNRRLRTIVTSFQDFKLRQKQSSPTFSYFLINNALLYHFLANWLDHNKKMTEKSVFRKGWSPEMASQSFPVSCFWSRGFVPHRKWNLTLLAHQNTGKEDVWKDHATAAHRWFELQNVLTKARDCHPYNERIPKDSLVSIHFTSWQNAETLQALPTLSLWFQWRRWSQTTLVSKKAPKLTTQNILEHWIPYEKKPETTQTRLIYQ